jgi:2'-hydroxyisoflavone reductase
VRLLVLGGTVFVGRHVVEAAVARGHEVTLFNRGRQNAHLFPGVERLRGDRDGDLEELSGRRWDAVVDPSGFTPAQVGATAELLADAVELYVFISSISAYRTPLPPGYDETWPLTDDTEGYGGEKARSEEAAERAMPGRVAHVRPGLVVGPHDPTDRFTYWPRRVAAGGEVLAPGRPERPVQFIDVRDLAEWTVELAERRVAGAFTAVGPAAPLTMRALLEECRAVTESDARFTWAPDDALLAEGLEPWRDLPLWMPEFDSPHGALLSADVSRAVAAGLRFRPVRDTIRTTLEWDRAEGAQPTERPILVVPISAEREAELLARVTAAPSG